MSAVNYTNELSLVKLVDIINLLSKKKTIKNTSSEYEFLAYQDGGVTLYSLVLQPDTLSQPGLGR